MRTLELARERTAADGAIALVTGGNGTPIVATVGLSESETNHIARMGFPDYRGARAIEVAFSGDLIAPKGWSPCARASSCRCSARRSRTACSVSSRATRAAGSARTTSMRSKGSSSRRGRRSRVRSTSASRTSCRSSTCSTSLLDRQSFPSVIEREILRARLASHPLSLLVLDVDRLTALNARIGILAADGVLLELAKRLRAVVHRLDYAFRLGGGRFAVVRPGSEGVDARELFEALRADLEGHPIGDAGVISISGGVAELLTRDDAESLVSDGPKSALAHAKRGGAAP